MSEGGREELNAIARCALESVVRLRENHAMIQSGIKVYTESINNILETFVCTLQAKLAKNDEETAEIFQKAARELILSDPLKEVSTEHRIRSCMKLYCGLVDPVPVKQGIGFFPTYGEGSESLGAKTSSAVCIPMLDQLKTLFQYQEMRELCFTVQSRVSTDDTLIKSVYDGSVYKNHPALRDPTKKYLLLSLYHDDVELCNPLGSHVKTNKVTMIYWSILNMPDHIRSSLKAINLQGVATSETVAGRVENTIGQTRRDVVGAVETDTILEKRATVTQTGSSSTSSKDIFGVEDIKLVRWLRSSMTKISVEKVDELVAT
ncbi:Hypothetical predicted protein [Cloeon dipterum]|uniref:Uncharacterized protein n=1 Tax=Cloeon dipterum TaxID=197152 RepID=A0A8S1DH52_9INSE|nr:Hypothetical predicted protein [Cloeon dipterum]